MNTNRLMDDIRASLNNENSASRENIFDASLALAANLVTNALNGDLSDSNLELFLDRRFLKLVLKMECQPHWLGHKLPLLLYGLFYLRSEGKPSQRIANADHSFLLGGMHDLYQGSMPTGKWDNYLIQESNNGTPCLLEILRPDISDLIGNATAKNRWMINHGMKELPVLRASVCNNLFSPTDSEPKLFKNNNGVGLFIQKISASLLPLPEDLFFDGIDFDRWICIAGAMLIFKKNNDAKRLQERRWLKYRTSIIIRNNSLGPTGKILLLLGALGSPGDFTIEVDLGLKGIKRYCYQGMTSLICELHVQKWVDISKITVISNCNYVAQLEMH